MNKILSHHFKHKYPVIYSIIIGIGLIMFWRGLWGIMDLYLFPHDELYSYISSAVIGLIILYINDFRLNELEER
ncbi:hypothetical protein KJ855_03235 [Patescibacteria group bacterium]|nr:hypothetical protein [Patescibacteria group bacterium]